MNNVLTLETKTEELLTSEGIVKDGVIPDHLALYIAQADRALDKVIELVGEGRLTEERGHDFQELLVDSCKTVICHPIVSNNQYLARFAEGVSFEQAQHEVQQFSVFAMQFNVAQAQLIANAPSLQAYDERLKLLLNEEGVPYAHGFEGELSGKWKRETNHFTWLRNMASGLGLEFEDMGKIWLALPGTKKFIEATLNYYASTEQSTCSGASFGIENWAANGLWKPWISGMNKLNESRDKPINIGYLTYHDKEEQHHSQATIDELLENFLEPWFDSGKFLTGAEAILNEGIQPYYESQLSTCPDKDATWPAAAC
jgi:pyrroloquinoline quinone (PQQ) biosynthesis protein C